MQRLLNFYRWDANAVRDDLRGYVFQVRKYEAWYRHITLSMLAAAFLAITAHRERLRDQKRAPRPPANA